MEFEKGYVEPNIEKTLGEVVFVRAEKERVKRDETGAETGELLERRYDLTCVQGGFTVVLPASSEKVTANFGDAVTLVNPTFMAYAIQNEGDNRANVDIKVMAEAIKVGGSQLKTPPVSNPATSQKDEKKN
ncbi:DUF961 family protein [Carnobacterium divergens]|uniref:DUF961 family protein n=1 Tax=Carnobacterium divergens TaxID=2748 RepID=UPI00289104F0|nr:DUF961 family protein [Carnobacterium divergens]MDT2010801.1 YdcP family protein [Carnobacterium divergens]